MSDVRASTISKHLSLALTDEVQTELSDGAETSDCMSTDQSAVTFSEVTHLVIK